LIPMALINLVAVMIVKELNWSLWVLTPVSFAVVLGAGLIAATPATPVRKVPVQAPP